MRTIGILLAGLMLLVSGCGSSSSTSAEEQQLQQQADINAIDQIEKTWHRAGRPRTST